MAKKNITLSGLVNAGVINADSGQVLPKFKSDSDFAQFSPTQIPLNLITPNPYQPRRIFPDDELQSLADSIAEIGLIQPIALRKVKDDVYQIIAGERRFRAFQLLAKPEIPCLIFSCDDADMAVMAITENVNREDLSDYEIGLSIRKVENQFPSKTKLAEALGFQREDMYRYFAFEALPEFLIAKLEANPRLLSRNAAADIKSVLAKTPSDLFDLALSALKEAIQLLESGELDQTKIAKFIATKIKNVEFGPVNRKEEFYIDGRKVGYFSSSNKGVLIKVSANVLTDEHSLRLQDVINQFIASLKNE